MTVPDLAIGGDYYELFGLEAKISGNEMLLRCPDRDQDQIRLFEGKRKRLNYISFGTDPAGFSAIKQRP